MPCPAPGVILTENKRPAEDPGTVSGKGSGILKQNGSEERKDDAEGGGEDCRRRASN